MTDSGWLYVYGGHVAPTHDYSRTSVSGAFHRFDLTGGTWERLPGGVAVQGVNLVARDGWIYRVGGMQPANEPGQPSEPRSLREAARFNVASKKWEALPPLPEPRSSHDVVIVDGKLIVIGGWNMRGGDPAAWAETMDILNLDEQPLRWRSVAQPFKRRAFVAAVKDRSVYVIGGFDEKDTVLDQVDIYDVTTSTWSRGPSLPKGRRNGFAPAACVLDGRVYVSVFDGGLHRLSAGKDSWERVATTTPRLAHRMAPAPGSRLILLGGAENGDNLDLVEAVTVVPSRTAAGTLRPPS